MIASLAMITGQTYAQVKADLHPWLYLPRGEGGGCGGIGETEAEGYLAERGFAWSSRFRHFHAGVCDRAAWPPQPWADVHLCTVVTSMAHAVVMLGDGSVLDPNRGVVGSLAAYSAVQTVRGVWRVRSVLPEAILHHEPSTLRRPSTICMCKELWG
jgi:hypothetical protein